MGATFWPTAPKDTTSLPSTPTVRPYIPFHLTTREFFREVREHLTENGVVAINAGRTQTDWSLVEVLASTLKAEFPNVYLVDLAEPRPTS